MNYRILYWVLPLIMLFSASSVFSAGSDSNDSSSSADTSDVNYLNGKEQLRIRITRQPFGICLKQLKRILKTQMSIIYSVLVIVIWK